MNVETVSQEGKTHLIKNFESLTTTPLRADALSILEEGYISIQTDTVVHASMRRDGDVLIIRGNEIHLDRYERIFFVGIGKCAADAAKAIEPLIEDKLTGGVVIDVRGVSLGKISSRIGTHPLPSEQNVSAAQEIKELLRGVTERDLIITVISGGGSALLCLPHDMSCQALSDITESLMNQGATIEEINTVRKHTSDIQGGQFAALAYPAEVYAIIFSDVPGNEIGTIASGPTVMDTSTKEDAERILVKYQVRTLCKLPHCDVIETPKEEKYFEKVRNILVLTNLTPLRAMARKAKDLGYQCEIVDARVEGEARDVGARIASEAHVSGMCLLYGGETTVTVKKKGAGGRSQEFVLGALAHLGDDTVIVATASDGWDNSDKAGAIADKETLMIAQKLSLDPEMFLANNTSYEFFRAAGGHIETGRMGSNVSDMYFTLTGIPKRG